MVLVNQCNESTCHGLTSGGIKMQSRIKNAFKSYLFDGLLLVALGVVMLIWPEDALKILCIGGGILLIVLGLIKSIVFFANKEDHSVPGLIIGIAEIALGIALIIKWDFFITAFQFITGIILIYGSGLMFIRAFALRREKGPIFAASIVFGILILVFAALILLNPLKFAAFITQLHAVALILEGLSMIIVMARAQEARAAAKAAIADAQAVDVEVIEEKSEE